MQYRQGSVLIERFGSATSYSDKKTHENNIDLSTFTNRNSYQSFPSKISTALQDLDIEFDKKIKRNIGLIKRNNQ